MNVILYTAGSHGKFLKFLFDCYTHGKILETNFNKNGNSHRHPVIDKNNHAQTLAFDICSSDQYAAWQNFSNETKNIYGILWEGIEEFHYIVQAYTSRGSALTEDGINLIENDLKKYENIYGTKVYIAETLKKYFNFDCEKLGQPPRGLLRNYFLLCFFKYFEHICWLKNKELSRLSHKNYKTINLKQLLDYTALEKFFFKIFKTKLDFQSVHQEFLNKNIPLKQLYKVKEILNAIDKGDSLDIVGLNVVSEAYVLFFLECKHFDIPFLLGDSFFGNTIEFYDYIKYFPNYMKKPNNLFHTHHKHFRRQKDSNE